MTHKIMKSRGFFVLLLTVLAFMIAGMATASAQDKADTTGYATDSSGKNVIDAEGNCVRTSGWDVQDSTVACEGDKDGDGVPDPLDKCPGTPKGVKVNAQGCSVDSDGDGVPDGKDRCPNTASGVEVDSQGCPLDSDGDGVPNDRDQCPNTPKGAEVDSHGCARDSDGDGVPDYRDQCPGTPSGATVDDNGCRRLIQGQVIELKGVKFAFDSAKLSASSNAILNKAAETLKRNSDVRVEVAGYTDSTGPASYNKGLSQRRADSVKDYLVDQGVDPDQLDTMGYGESHPIATNDTKEGRLRNRRVELNVLGGR